MNRLVRLSRTSIGRKLVMAVTGVLLGVFVVLHLLGNLLVYRGQDAMNEYAYWIKGHPIVWFGRLGLLLVFGAHVYTGIELYFQNRRARPRTYLVDATVQASLSSRHMLLSGLLVLAFVVYHLLHLTFGVISPGHFGQLDDSGRRDVFSMIVHGFQNPAVFASYVFAMVLLGLHLSHAVPSFFQTLGLNHESYNVLIKVLGLVLVVVVVAGFCSIPISVYLGLIQVPAGK